MARFDPSRRRTITAAVGGRADQSRASSNDVNAPISDTEDIRSNVLSSVPFRSPHADGEGMVASFRALGRDARKPETACPRANRAGSQPFWPQTSLVIAH